MESIENDVATYLTTMINRSSGLRIIWLEGLGDGSGLLRLLEHVTVKAVSNMIKPMYTIRLKIPSIIPQTPYEPQFKPETYIAIAIANALGIIDPSSEKKIKKLKDELDEELFYNYSVNGQKESNLVDELVAEIFEKLEGTSYLLLIEHLEIGVQYSYQDRAIQWLVYSGWLPQPSKWNRARWVISTPSYKRVSNIIPWDNNRDVSLNVNKLINDKYWKWSTQPHQIVEVALLFCAQSMAPAVGVRETIGINILRSCLLYSLLLSPEINDQLSESIEKNDFSEDFKRSSTWNVMRKTPVLYDMEEETKVKFCCGQHNCIVLHKDLVDFWVAEGLFTRSRISTMAGSRFGSGDEEEGEVDLTDSLNAANVVLEALHSHSLIQHIYSYHFLNRKLPIVDFIPVPFIGMRKFLGTPLGAQNDISSPIDWENKSWISFLGDDGKWIIDQHHKTNKTTAFLYRASSRTSQSTINTVLMKMSSNLRVLDLSYSSFDALPTSIANLTNLRLLSLKSCKKIRTLRPYELGSSPSALPSTLLQKVFQIQRKFHHTKRSKQEYQYSPIAMLQKLSVLNLNGVPLAQVPEEIGWDKRCLYSLDLSCPTITYLPEKLFSEMSSLRELFLVGCTSLKSLPTSLATLFHLEDFSLSQSLVDSLPCNTFEKMQRLRMLKLIDNHSLMHLPDSLSRASMLQELHIHDCTALREVNVAGHASLKSFSLSKSPHISRLSLYACHALETVALSDLVNLMELDLSFTSIKDFPVEVCNQGSLRRLDLISVCQLKRVRWGYLWNPLPEVFNLVTHECTVDESLQLLRDGIGVKIFASDSRILSRFTSKLVLDDQRAKLRTFYICLSEQRNQSMSRDMSSNNQFHNKNPYYEVVPLFEYKFVQHFVQSNLCRQVEICSVGKYPSGLQVVLDITESLLVRDDAFISSLTDLNQEFLELQECKLEGCHLTEVVFRETNRPKGKKLQNLWISNLSKLSNVLHGSFQFDEFWALKNVNLQDCPRLVTIFPGNLKLPCLETLSIVCCYDLTTVFYYCQANDKDQFPRLRSIKLHQLPQLSQLYDCQEHPFRMPEWKELTFRECWNLSRLPLLTKTRDQKVFVDGDIRQYKMFLSEMDKDQLSSYHFKSLPQVISFKERVMNRIVLK